MGKIPVTVVAFGQRYFFESLGMDFEIEITKLPDDAEGKAQAKYVGLHNKEGNHCHYALSLMPAIQQMVDRQDTIDLETECLPRLWQYAL